MITNKKWLITGAAGFIGSHTADYLLANKQQVLGLDNFSTGTTSNVARLHEKYGENWRCMHVDIRDKETITQLFKHYRPDYVIHLAAQVSVPLSITQPQETQAINVDGFLNVLLAAKTYAAQRFIYISSSAVYGDQPVLPVKETAALQPLSFYGLSKQVNEEYAALFATDSFKCIGLRLFNIFGPHQRADSPYSGVIAQWLTKIQAGNPITVYGDGTATRDYCYVGNVTQAIYQLAAATLPHKHVLYNIGNGQATSLHTLHETIAKLTGRNTTIEHAPWRVSDILHSQADIQLAQQEFGYQITTNLTEGLQITLQEMAPAKS
jgi:UDP-N-acetylglucosamine 4-epimerase